MVQVWLWLCGRSTVESMLWFNAHESLLLCPVKLVIFSEVMPRYPFLMACSSSTTSLIPIRSFGDSFVHITPIFIVDARNL